MKRLAFVITILSIISCNEQPSALSADNNKKDSFLIKLNIRNIPDGVAKLVYRVPDNSEQKVIDSTLVKNGSFTFSGKLAHPEMLSILVKPGNWGFNIFTENAAIAIHGDTSGSDYFDQTKYGGPKGAMLKNYTVTGSVSQDEWNTFNNDPSLKKYDPVMREFYDKSSVEKNAVVAAEYHAKGDSVMQLQTAEKMKWIDAFVSRHPTSVAGAYMLSSLYSLDQHNTR